MTGELEAAGALATAGVVGANLEGREGGPPGEGDCANCGAKLTGPFCAQCGQHAYPRRKLIHVIAELAHGLFYLETKTWRTMPMVIFRPGTLTRDYVFGKRARYLSPLTMFLFAIFLMFFAFSTIEAPSNFRDGPSHVTADDITEARTELTQAQTELEQARTNPDPDSPEGLEQGLAEGAVTRAQAHLDRLERRLAEQEAAAAAPETPASPVTTDQPAEQPATEAAPSPSASPETPTPADDGESTYTTWQDEMRAAARSDEFTVMSGNETLNERVRSKFENPDLALYQVQDAASRFSFLLAPLSLPFIMLLFLWKRGVTMYDHMAYALYALSFAAILFSVIVLIGKIPAIGWGAAWLLAALPVHMFFHLGGAYKLGWWSALWRTALMLNFALIIGSVFLVLVVVLGLAG